MFESLTGEQLSQNNNICVAWDANALQYLAKGYSVVPLAPKQKGPKLNGWTKYCEELMRPEYVKDFCGKNNNIGLALGSASGICAVDIDTDDPQILSKIEKILPESPVKKRGAKGYTAFYKFNGLPSKSVRNQEGTAGIDFLSTGKQTVLPPSIHPSGMEYCWLTQQTLLNTAREDLPELSGTVLDQLLALFKPRFEMPHVEVEKHYADVNVEIAKKALSFIDPDQSYDTWIQVGLALQDGFGPITGSELFVDWSSRGAKFDGIAECMKKFRSFHDPREITIATLFYIAKENGYQGEDDFDLAAIRAKAEVGAQLLDSWAKQDETVTDNRAHLIDIITHPVGLIADIYEWMRKVSYLKQDLFSVAAATSLASVFYAHKFRGRSNSYTNNYIICVGPTGCGKSMICDNAQWLMANAPTKLHNRLMGEMASAPGLIDELVRKDGIAYSYIDEIGQFFRFSKGENSSQYTQAIGTEMTKIYSKAHTSYTTQAYSAAAKRPVREIDHPCLIIFGQSVPGRLYDSVTKEDFRDGFFNRFTLIEITKDEIPVRNPDYVAAEDCPPTEIYEFWNHLDSWTTNEIHKISSCNGLTGGVNTLSVPYTDKAKEMLEECWKYYKETLPETLDDADVFKDALTRAHEMIEKYALTSCEFVDERPIITERSVRWARAFVDFHLLGLKSHVRELADTQYGRDCIKMKNSVSVGRRYTKQEFFTATNSIHIGIRQKMIDDLVTQGVFAYEKDENGTYIIRKR